jgi:MFS family permease
VGALPGGILVDRYGSKRLVIARTFGIGASFVILSVALGVVAIMVPLAL